MRQIAYREALREAMSEEMARDERVYLMGEEVGAYQGAYKVTQGMLEQFGEKRVVDTPIAECGFAGVGIGSAMVGLRPIIEFMTLNFSLVAFDQLINNAAKLRLMSGGQITLPIVFRGPGGGAHQLGAQHSQCTEPFYCYTPGLKVVMPATPRDAKGLLKSAIRDENPVVFIESEVLYGFKGEVPEEEYTIPLGVAEVVRPGKDLTIVAWSKMQHLVKLVLPELEKQGIDAEVIDPRTLRPLDEDAILASVRKTSRLLIVEEGWPYGGVGAQIAYLVQRNAFDYLDAPVERVTSEDVPMPYAANLEKAALPSVEKVFAAVNRLLGR
ncbi:MAG: pyruvate dehydrogenase complex E1 component subunit beta [Deltaproteobacteria bacterium]|nr:pyruvate dehydrogenase complex E1 component subunit beta [Deltaproteobacteria bacterium]